MIEKYVEINKELIGSLDQLLEAGDWQASLFLKMTSKQIQELRDQAEKLLIEATGQAVREHTQAVAEKTGFVKVYISLYQAEGTNLQRWYRTVKSLTEFNVSRPVYRDEDQIKTTIRAKTDVTREGYVIVFVKPEDILNLQQGKVATDKWGNELVTLKPTAVKLENIAEFVHCQKRYEVCGEGLVLIAEISGSR